MGECEVIPSHADLRFVDLHSPTHRVGETSNEGEARAKRSRLDLRQQNVFPREENQGAALPFFLTYPGQHCFCLVVSWSCRHGDAGKGRSFVFFFLFWDRPGWRLDQITTNLPTDATRAHTYNLVIC